MPAEGPSRRGGHFATTHWSLVLAAGRRGGTGSDEALAKLCELYWFPVYAFVRRQGHSPDDAADLTQEFFARVLEKSYLQTANPCEGRFRSFLIACLRHFLSNERDRDRALKRGGGHRPLSLDLDLAEDRYHMEPRDELTPDKIFDKRWALSLLDRTLGRLREEHVASGKERAFDALKGYLTGGSIEVPHAILARRLGTTEGAAKVAVHRLRRRFRDLLIEDVSATVADPAEVEDEIRYLMTAVSAR